VCLTHPAVNPVVALAAAGDDGTAAASARNEPATPGEREVARVFEVRIHGRGGQGAVTAAELLAAATFAEGSAPLTR